MIILKTESQIKQIKKNGRILRSAINLAAEKTQPGMSTSRINKIIEDYILSQGATPTFKGYRGFPAASCISPNDLLVHGIPDKRKVKEGDLIKVERLDKKVGDQVELNEVLMLSGDEDTIIGTPLVQNSKVNAVVEEQGRGRKIVVFKMKRRKGYTRKQGHRQDFTALRITDIEKPD